MCCLPISVNIDTEAGGGCYEAGDMTQLRQWRPAPPPLTNILTILYFLKWTEIFEL